MSIKIGSQDEILFIHTFNFRGFYTARSHIINTTQDMTTLLNNPVYRSINP